MDFAALTRDNLGRRVNAVKPDESLLLLKATGQIAHDGGMRFGKDAWVYNTFREWIRAGAKWTPGQRRRSRSSRSRPADFAVLANDKPLPAEGRRPPSPTARPRTSPRSATSASTTTPSPSSRRSASSRPRQPGDAGLTVLYRGSVQADPRARAGAAATAGGYPDVPEVNYIDREVFAKLKLLNMVPSDLAADAEFLRRVTIDTIGQLPTPDEVRAFRRRHRPEEARRS